jgi:RNA polymerase-associated protein RTF1
LIAASDLAPDFVKPYKINDKSINQAFELKHGKSLKTFNMDKVSNGPFLEVGYFYLLLLSDKR